MINNQELVDYIVTTSPVHGGFDLTISHDERAAVLFIQDTEQANLIANNIIKIAIAQKININTAFAIFNSTSKMFNE